MWDNALDNMDGNQQLGDKRYLNSKRVTNAGDNKPELKRRDSIDLETPRDPNFQDNLIKLDLQDREQEDVDTNLFVIDDPSPEKRKKVDIEQGQSQIQNVDEIQKLDDYYSEEEDEEEQEDKDQGIENNGNKNLK